MIISNILRALLVVCLLFGPVAYGCASKGLDTRFYILDPLPQEIPIVKADKADPISIDVVSLSLPQYLERPQIVTRGEGNRLELAELHQWGENLRKNMVRVIAKNLSNILQTPDVSIGLRNPISSPDFRIELVIMKFERDPDGKVRLTAKWSLSGGRDNTPIIIKFSELESLTVPAESDMGRTVAAMNSIVGDLSLIIGNEIIMRSYE